MSSIHASCTDFVGYFRMEPNSGTIVEHHISFIPMFVEIPLGFNLFRHQISIYYNSGNAHMVHIVNSIRSRNHDVSVLG